LRGGVTRLMTVPTGGEPQDAHPPGTRGRKRVISEGAWSAGFLLTIRGAAVPTGMTKRRNGRKEAIWGLPPAVHEKQLLSGWNGQKGRRRWSEKYNRGGSEGPCKKKKSKELNLKERPQDLKKRILVLFQTPGSQRHRREGGREAAPR